MPRYYLQVADGRYDRDVIGTEFPDDTEAQRQAIVFADEILQSDPVYLLHNVDLRLYVADKSNLIIFSITIFASSSSFKTKSISSEAILTPSPGQADLQMPL
ncbi:MAG: DUF6894 family protein [Janthinobacterium lividum]